MSEFRGATRVVVPAERIYEVLKLLKEEHGFDLLVDVTCVNYLNYPGAKDRFGLVYLLAGTVKSQRLTIRTFVNEPEPAVRSVVGLWEGANWLEREVWDMFGIRFEDHPDLRRVLHARGVHGLSAPQGLSPARARRAAQLPRAYPGQKLNAG